MLGLTPDTHNAASAQLLAIHKAEHLKAVGFGLAPATVSVAGG
jgi:hypothetical protein